MPARNRSFPVGLTPYGTHILAMVAVGETMVCQIIPEKTCPRIVNVRLIVLNWKFSRYIAAKVAGALRAAIGDVFSL